MIQSKEKPSIKTWLKALLPLALAVLLLCACASAWADTGPTMRLPSKVVAPPTAADITPAKMLVPYRTGEVLPAGKCLIYDCDGLSYQLFYEGDGSFSHIQISTEITDQDGWRLYYEYIPYSLDALPDGYYEGCPIYADAMLSRNENGVYEYYSYQYSYDGGTAANGRLETVYYYRDGFSYRWDVQKNDGWYLYEDGKYVYADPGVEKNPDLVPMPKLVFTGRTLKLWSASGAGDDVLFLPTGLTAIGAEAFSGVAAQKVVVPDGCRSIASKAFVNCPRLVELSVPAACAIADGAVPAGVTVTRR